MFVSSFFVYHFISFFFRGPQSSILQRTMSCDVHFVIGGVASSTYLVLPVDPFCIGAIFFLV